MSEMTVNASSDDTLIRDSQLSGFAVFKERLSACCCRLFMRTANYDLSSISKDIEEQQDKPSYINQAVQREKQARNDKLEKIAKTLPNATSNGIQGIRTTNTVPQTPLRSITQATPRSGISIGQTRPQIPISKRGISTINKPSPLASNTKNNKKDSDETSTGLLLNSLKLFEKQNLLNLI